MTKDDYLLEGAIDVHIHVGPSLFPRLMDPIEAAKAAKDAGMRGIVFKNHHLPTVDRALLANKVVPEVEIYGGIVLNYSVGGLNPFAVDAALKLGGKIVWMPTIDARNHLKHFGELGAFGSGIASGKPKAYGDMEGLTVWNQSGGIDVRIGQILDTVAEAGAAIATSHLSVDESKALLMEAIRRKVRRFMVTHAFFVTADLSLSEQRWMAERGALLELCYATLLPNLDHALISRIVETLEKIGAENYIISSDLGQARNSPPSHGLRRFIQLLINKGVSTEEIEMMVKFNPEKLLGLR